MTSIVQTVNEERREYEGGASRPTRAYFATLLTYGGCLAALAGLTRLRGRTLPDSLSPRDLFLISLSTHKLSRTLAKDPVASPLRAPFTRFKGASGPAELHEEVRGTGARHAVGELLTCPFCLAQWVATAHVAGLIFAPRATRLAAGTMTAVAFSDWLQLAYAWLQQRAED
ncbi:hypothetical protein HNR12_005365 [Streptomonospora nanhaiensis]|uniref:DUF1360 domain-containing protein n=1 Tax=Streptomonospora nanhaiensis TaxID=1323731 RepID=A0A853BUX2_9ACTN|nr:DUF1360 domain-containing protein [Streptomonospora nanhaiensis]NYI99088.1 hypothetical protein [Streptomonospora nanhaiensis]